MCVMTRDNVKHVSNVDFDVGTPMLGYAQDALGVARKRKLGGKL